MQRLTKAERPIVIIIVVFQAVGTTVMRGVLTGFLLAVAGETGGELAASSGWGEV